MLNFLWQLLCPFLATFPQSRADLGQIRCTHSLTPPPIWLRLWSLRLRGYKTCLISINQATVTRLAHVSCTCTCTGTCVCFCLLCVCVPVCVVCATGKWIYVAHAMRNMPLHLPIKRGWRWHQEPQQIRSRGAPGLAASWQHPGSIPVYTGASWPQCRPGWTQTQLATFTKRGGGWMRVREILFIEANMYLCVCASDPVPQFPTISPAALSPIPLHFGHFGLPFRLAPTRTPRETKLSE